MENPLTPWPLKEASFNSLLHTLLESPLFLHFEIMPISSTGKDEFQWHLSQTGNCHSHTNCLSRTGYNQYLSLPQIVFRILVIIKIRCLKEINKLRSSVCHCIAGIYCLSMLGHLRFVEYNYLLVLVLYKLGLDCQI